jgi:hypothetical protein
LVEDKLFPASSSQLRAFGQPTLRPERIRVRAEVARVVLHCVRSAVLEEE